MSTGGMIVIKRDGKVEPVSFDKILWRLQQSCREAPSLHAVDPTQVSQQVISGLISGMTTRALDEEAARLCALKADLHPDYLDLAARIATSNHDKNTRRFGETFMDRMMYLSRPEFDVLDPQWAEQLLPVADALNELWESTHFQVDYFGFKTLERSYLLKAGSDVIERPKDLLLRVSCYLYSPRTDWEAVVDCFTRMCRREFIHASPTLFNSGTKHPQLLSCFLGGMHDSLDGIFEGLHTCARISKFAGGIGLHLHDIRGRDARIKGTNGKADGLPPLLRVLNETARYINQGGKRNGSIAVFLEPHHPDILDFLEMKRNTGLDSERARQLFYGVWLSDLFMKRVEADASWSLFDPSETGYRLSDTFGQEYEQIYTELESNVSVRRQTVSARQVWKALLLSQMETGVPYIGFKDHVNHKSAHSHLGVVRSSNLCMEIVEYSNDKEWACCTLASVALPTFATYSHGKPHFDFEGFRGAVSRIVRNLNRIIDKNEYPTVGTRTSNLTHRPLGIGVQGLADVFSIWRIAFDSPEAKAWNKVLFEALYFAAVSASAELAQENGSFGSFEGSTWSKGVLQCDMWDGYHDRQETCEITGVFPFDWKSLRANVQKGMYNSMLTALMPTATTSQILGFNECFEPYTSQMYIRRTMAGEFILVNRYLVNELMELNLWTPEVREQIIQNRGSVASIEHIPESIRHRYRTVWEMKQSSLIETSAERGPFVDQSQSLNLFMDGPTVGKLHALHFKAWNLGLKTGIYYLRNRPASHMQQFGVTMAAEKEKEKEKEKVKESESESQDQSCRRIRGADGKWTKDPTCESCSA
jgi:ribonucleoside-diphosphate reductase alpha chain